MIVEFGLGNLLGNVHSGIANCMTAGTMVPAEMFSSAHETFALYIIHNSFLTTRHIRKDVAISDPPRKEGYKEYIYRPGQTLDFVILLCRW